MSNHFSQVPRVGVQRSVFDRSFTLSTTLRSLYVLPIYYDEVLPGDTINLKMSSVIRTISAFVSPVMDSFQVDFHAFFVPNRLVWDHWKNFMGEELTPGTFVSYNVPKLKIDPSKDIKNIFTPGSIFDYMGIPICTAANTGTDKSELPFISALPFRAYSLIWNEWYRDQNLQARAQVKTDDSDDEVGYYILRVRNKRQDYFTSALPFPQKGPSVPLPLGTQAPVIGTGMTLGLMSPGGLMPQQGLYEGADALSGHSSLYGVSAGTPTNVVTNGVHRTVGVTTDPQFSGLVADLSDATAATVNDIRMAFQLQRFLERDARGGTRYQELLLSHFGVVSPDARLQRPEFIGGFSVPINVSPVAQTSQSNGAVGDLGAFGAAVNGNGFRSYSATEHGMIFVMASIRSQNTYYQGIPRKFSRQLRTDYYFPVFAHLGEQTIKNKELYVQYNQANNINEEPFGYQEAWAEYRYNPDRLSGLVNPSAADTIGQYTFAQNFTATPVLNSSFIHEEPAFNRVFAVNTTKTHRLVANIYFKMTWARPMPVYSVPGLIDHF